MKRDLAIFGGELRMRTGDRDGSETLPVMEEEKTEDQYQCQLHPTSETKRRATTTV